MTDILLDACGDIDITEGRITIVGGADAVRQRWLIYIRTFLGEWFLDQSIGVPFTQVVFAKQLSRQTLKQVFTTASLQVPGILQVVSVIVDELNVQTRFAEVTVTCVINGDEGPETGEFKFTGAIPDSCDAPVPAPETVAGLLVWFDASDISSVLLNNPGTDLEFKNKAGIGKLVGADSGVGSPELSGGVINRLSAVRLNNDPGNIDDGDHMLIQDVPAIRGAVGPEITVFIVTRWIDETPAASGRIALWSLDGVEKFGIDQEWYSGFARVNTGSGEPGMDWRSEEIGSGTIYGGDIAPAVTPPWDDEDTLVRSWRSNFSSFRALVQQGVLLDSSAYVANPLERLLNGQGLIGAAYDQTDGSVDTDFRLNGFWCEYLVWGRALGAAEMDTIFAYLLAKWGETEPTP